MGNVQKTIQEDLSACVAYNVNYLPMFRILYFNIYLSRCLYFFVTGVGMQYVLVAHFCVSSNGTLTLSFQLKYSKLIKGAGGYLQP
jgi:hypothetical protein